MKLSHRPTRLPGADPDHDRAIISDGRDIARVFRIDAGQNAGRWRWASRWSPAEGEIVETLDEALRAIKATVTEEKLKMLPPEPRPKQSDA